MSTAPNVDTLVQKISTGYNVTGSIESVTSYTGNDNVINQVKYEYDDNQKLARLYQSHGGAVNIFANEADVCTHDRNGNMTLMPGLKDKYDVWNRLVEVRDSANSLIARYDYNGVNQRIQKVKDNVVTHSYFNEQWQELETREPGTVSPNSTYVWGIRYIDDLICRQRSAEKLYSLADPNWNVVATADSTGAVQERLKYDAFGKVSGLTSDWNRTFTGQVLDSDTGLMLYRNRYYHTELGRFVTRDPIGYEAGDWNLFRYVFNAVPGFVDPTGLQLPGQKEAVCRPLSGTETEEHGCTYVVYLCECPRGYYTPNGGLTGQHKRPLGQKPTVYCNKSKNKKKYESPKPVPPVIRVVPLPEPVQPNIPWYEKILRIPVRIPIVPIVIPEPILRAFDPTTPQQA